MFKSVYIGNVEFCLEVEDGVSFGKELLEYLKPLVPVTKRVHYQIKHATRPESFPFQYRATVENPPQMIGNVDGGECRIIRELVTGQLKAIYKEISANRVELTFYGDNLCLEIGLLEFSYMATERQLIFAEAMVLHSSFIVQNGKAILFTAPSGTGKSTQADLWERYRGSKIMNGDRSLLVKTEEGWRVLGYPFSGSSGMNHNGMFEIAAIVMIHQANENVANDCNVLQGFKRIYPEIIRNYWNLEFENKTIELLNDLLPSIRLITLGCNMKEDAVCCLERKLAE